MSRIFIVGAGLVGLATGRALRGAGHQVTFIDTDPDRVAELSGRGLDARPELSLTGEGESFIVITLPTPAAADRPERADGPDRVAGPGGRTADRQLDRAAQGYDLGALRDGVRAVGRALATADSRHIVVVRSTVPPGTTDGMVRHLLERVSGKRAGAGFDLVCQPEFLRPGHADHDAQWPVLTVVGTSDHRVADRVARELAPFGGVLHLVGSAAAAEMIKCVHVVQRTVNTGFWKEISAVSMELGIDVSQVARVLAEDNQLWAWVPPASPMVLPGARSPEFGDEVSATARSSAWRVPAGRTPEEYLAKDAEAFLGAAADAGVPTPLLAAAVAAGAGGPADSDRVISLHPEAASLPNGRS